MKKRRCDSCGRSVNAAQLQPREVVSHLHTPDGEIVLEPEIWQLCRRCQMEGDASPERPGGELTDAERQQLLRRHRTGE
jgi:hypothetical protein